MTTRNAAAALLAPQMKRITLDVRAFKEELPRVLDAVESQGTAVIIAKGGRPIARPSPCVVGRKPLRGSWKSIVKIKGDIAGAGSQSDWECQGWAADGIP